MAFSRAYPSMVYFWGMHHQKHAKTVNQNPKGTVCGAWPNGLKEVPRG
jgi:hypothetical protein